VGLQGQYNGLHTFLQSPFHDIVIVPPENRINGHKPSMRIEEETKNNTGRGEPEKSQNNPSNGIIVSQKTFKKQQSHKSTAERAQQEHQSKKSKTEKPGRKWPPNEKTRRAKQPGKNKVGPAKYQQASGKHVHYIEDTGATITSQNAK
jgi:hypothetical protein